MYCSCLGRYLPTYHSRSYVQYSSKVCASQFDLQEATRRTLPAHFAHPAIVPPILTLGILRTAIAAERGCPVRHLVSNLCSDFPSVSGNSHRVIAGNTKCLLKLA